MPDSSLEHLRRLIAFPTLSSASNLELVASIRAHAESLGGRCREFPDASGTKASLFVSFGPDVAGGLLLSGHTDVVPVAGQDWSGDPWNMRTDDHGRAIGRGATDMKGFVACCMQLMQSLAHAPLRLPVHFAFSYDEEVGCLGVWPMAQWLRTSGLAPRLAVIGEPTMMRLALGHKGGMIGWAHLTGKPGHSSTPDRFVNAVMAAGELIAEINRVYADMRTGPSVPGFDPPHSTIQVNRIRGGEHGNIVAESCSFFWEMRTVPGDDPERHLERIARHAREHIEPAMQAVSPDTGIRLEVVARIPALRPDLDAATVAELLALLGQDQADYVPFGTEAGIFQWAGVPSVVIGPGSIADAHQPDESIAIAQLHQCDAFLLRLAQQCH